MLEVVIKAVLKQLFAVDYPYLEQPAVVLARIDAAQKLEPYQLEALIIHNDESGDSFQGHITAYWYEYRLTILDRFGNPDPAFPTLPGIRSKKQFQQGAVVAAALPYGELLPLIIGEVEL